MILVYDNLNTHTKGAFYETFPPARAHQLVRSIEFCHTPKHGSWLNVADNELSSLTRSCIGGHRIGDLQTLSNRIAAWSKDVNQTQRGVDWQMKNRRRLRQTQVHLYQNQAVTKHESFLLDHGSIVACRNARDLSPMRPELIFL